MATPNTSQKPPFDRVIHGIPREMLERSFGYRNPEKLTELLLDPELEWVIRSVQSHTQCSPESLGDSLGLGLVEINKIIQAYSGSRDWQLKGILEGWVDAKGKEATVLRLLEALYYGDDVEAVTQIQTVVTSTQASDHERRFGTPGISESVTGSTLGVTVNWEMKTTPSVGSATLLPRSYFERNESIDSSEQVITVTSYQMKPMPLTGFVMPKRTTSRSDSSMSSPGGALSDDSMTRVEPLSSLMMGRPVEETSQNGAESSSMVPSSSSDERGKGGPRGGEMQQDVFQLKEDMEDVQSKLKTLNIQMEQVMNQNKEHENVIQKQDEKIEHLDEKVKKLNSQLKAKDHEIQQLKCQIEEVEKKLVATESSNEKLQRENESLHAALKAAEEDKKELICQILKERTNREYGQRDPQDVPDSGTAHLDTTGITAPQKIERWKLEKTLGKGSFGEVFQCHNVNTGRRLAVKRIPIKCDRGSWKEVDRETEMLRAVKHERIVQFVGFTAWCHPDRGSHLLIFMELMPGGSIGLNVRQTGPLTETLTRKYTRQLLEGVNFLHSEKIVHRDIKGDNIFLDLDGNLKLGDFGCAKILKGVAVGGKKSHAQGTAHWLPPESLRGDTHDFKSDIWSVAATVVEMLTARPPFSEIESQAVIFQLGTYKLRPTILGPPDFSEDARNFLSHCFIMEAPKRLSAQELLQTAFCLHVDHH